MTSFGLLSSKNDVNEPSKINKQKNFKKKISFLKVNGENSRIRIHTKMTWIRNIAFQDTLLVMFTCLNIKKARLELHSLFANSC